MEENFEFEIGGGYTLNYAEIANHKELMAVTRLLAKQLMVNPYLVVGDYIKELADSDLVALMNAEENETFEDLILISEMLATGEGCEQASVEEFKERTNQLVTLLVIESLGRKGLVRVFHENMSFHEDMKDKVVVEKIEGLNLGE